MLHLIGTWIQLTIIMFESHVETIFACFSRAAFKALFGIFRNVDIQNKCETHSILVQIFDKDLGNSAIQK